MTASSATASAIYTRAGAATAPIASTVALQMANGGDFVKAMVALNQFKATSARDAEARRCRTRSVRTVQIRLRAPGSGPVTIDLPTRPRPRRGRLAAARRDGPGGGAKENFDLSTFYSNDGALADSDNNLIPDRVDVLLSAEGDGAEGVIDLAARLGLESTGISLPIARTAKALTAPASEPILVLIGTSHPVVEQLIKDHKWEAPPLQPGEGLIQLVKKAFGEKSALIVTGGDAAGVRRAVYQLAETFPHIWQRGKDRTTLDDVEEDVRKFVAGRSPAGQAAMGLYKLDKIAAQLKGKDLASARVKVFVEKAADGLADVVKRQAAAAIKASSLTVDVQNLDVQKGRTLINDDFEIPSEVDEFWTKLRAKVIPGLKKKPAVTVEARLSEPPEIRRQIEQQARAELIKAGADEKQTTVTVLSAYKQGYSWLYDVVRPALAGKAVDQITIKFAEIGPPAGWKQQGMFAPTRWLLEIYPIDEILASELKIDLKNIHFEMAPIGSPAYEVIATARGGAPLLRQTFEPAIVERPFFDRFPDYEHVRVTTGWIKASVAGKPAVDERIATDPERFWDRFQSKTLPALYDHVMALGNGKPRAGGRAVLRRADRGSHAERAGVPAAGRRGADLVDGGAARGDLLQHDPLLRRDGPLHARRRPRRIPGRIIPVMHPKADGKPGRAKITVTGFDAARPSVVVEYTERNGQQRRGHGSTSRRSPSIGRRRWRRRCAPGSDGIERLDLRVKVDTEKDERDALVKRSDEFRVDRTMMSAEQVTAVLANLGRLRAAGLYRDALAYHDLGAVRVTVGWEHESKPATEVVATLEPNGAPAPFPTSRRMRRGRRPAASGRPSRRPARPVGHADPAARGERDPREDVVVQGSDRLQGRRELSRQGRLGDGPDAADRGVALVAGQADDDEADDRLLGAAARQRGVVDEPRAADGGAAAHRSRVPREAEQGQRRHPPDHERGRRAARLRSAEDQPDLHAARRLPRLARRRRDGGAVGSRSDLPGERHPSEDLAHLAARHLPQPARLPVARVGADLLRVRRVGAHALGRDARLLVDARLVDARLRAGSTMRGIRGTRTSR